MFMPKDFTVAKIIPAALLAFVLLWLPACTRPAQQLASSPQQNAPEHPKSQAPESTSNVDPSIIDRLKNERWTGDIDGMRERRYIRALVLYNKTNFFYDGPQPQG